MLTSLIILPDGDELASGIGTVNNIRSTAITECVNSSEELTLGSVCASMMEVVVQVPRGALSLTAGDEVELYRVHGRRREKVGLYTLEKPTRTSPHLLKLTGYDRVTKLDKDLTAWVKSLDGWPYTLQTFAAMVCEACGLELATESIPNGDYAVQRFEKEATGRQLMEWIGQICCRFCRATPDGKIELAWYEHSSISITPAGNNAGEWFFFQRTLVYEDYEVAPVAAVQVRLTDSEDGAPVPTVPEGTNTIVISDNPIFTAVTGPVMDAIMAELEKLPVYTPCKVSVPATMDLHAGHMVDITDSNGITITALVMTKFQRGQRDILECTGSPRRDSPTAINNRTAKDQAAGYERTALIAGKAATKNLTPEEVFAALTDNGAIQGLYLQDGKVYINAEFVQIVNLVAQSIVSGMLASADGSVYFDLDDAVLHTERTVGDVIHGITLKGGSVYGTLRNADENKNQTRYVFQLYNTTNGIYLTDMLSILDGSEDPVGVPMNIFSRDRLTIGYDQAPTTVKGSQIQILASDALSLGLEGDKVKIMGKTLVWAPNSDGQTYTLMGM